MGTTLDLIEFFTDGREPVSDPPIRNPGPALMSRLERGAEAELAAYRPAKECRHPKHCRNHKALLRILEKNPWIRRFHPRPNRLMVHRDDWAAYWADRAEKAPCALLADEKLGSAASREMCRRYERERARKKARSG